MVRIPRSSAFGALAPAGLAVLRTPREPRLLRHSGSTLCTSSKAESQDLRRGRVLRMRHADVSKCSRYLQLVWRDHIERRERILPDNVGLPLVEAHRSTSARKERQGSGKDTSWLACGILKMVWFPFRQKVPKLGFLRSILAKPITLARRE